MRALGATVAVMGGSALAVSAYLHVLRPWILHWGATPAEVAATLPGDELLDDADGVATRAITIHAGPEHVYPWLAQMGPAPRGGAYTYDWIDNLLGLDCTAPTTSCPNSSRPRSVRRSRWVPT